MCGIVGIYKNNQAVQAETIENMLSIINHRGPDEFACYLGRSIGLGSARLSIVDIRHGQQPIVNQEKSVALVFNGEIYNFRELRAELILKGYTFHSDSDTETIFNLFLEEGIECVKKLNGEFAIAIWDGRVNKLFLLRDRIGIRPLHYYYDGNILIFGSEIKSIFATGMAPIEINPEAIDQIFTFWTMIDGYTAFKGIKALPSSHYLEFDLQQVKIQRYWDWPFPSRSKTIELSSEQEYVEMFKKNFEESVSLRLKADVEVGAYLSGGIDSSATIAAALNFVKKLRTYSIGFESQSFDESSAQELVRKHLNISGKTITCSNDDINQNFEEVIWHAEQPIFRTAPVPLFMLSGLVRQDNIKVVLTGEGSDEILFGYDIFRELNIRKFWLKHPESNMRPQLLRKLYAYLPQFRNNRYANFIIDFYRKGLTDKSDFYSHMPRWLNSIYNKNYYSDYLLSELKDTDAIESLKRTLPKEYFEVSDIEKCQYLEVVTLLNGYLLSSQADRMSMAHSVEGRYPFLDHKFIEFANSLPLKIKLKGLKDKYVLRECYKNSLPKEIVFREKVAYQAPDIRGFIVNGQICELAKNLLTEENLSKLNWFPFEKISPLLEKATSSNLERTSTRDNMAFIQILSTQMLYRIFVENFNSYKKKFSRKVNMKVVMGYSN